MLRDVKICCKFSDIPATNTIKLIMKLFISLLLLSAFASCTRGSSPDGRSQIRDEKIQLQLDSIKHQNKQILDSIEILNQKIRKLQEENQ